MPDTIASAAAKTFDLAAWIQDTSIPTHSVTVLGKPGLIGQIEALRDRLEHLDATMPDDDRPMAKDPRVELARQLEALREEAHASATTWTMRGLRNGEVEKITAAAGEERTVCVPSATGDKAADITDLDYRIWAAQVQQVNGQDVEVTWENLRDLHASLGTYFLQTIARCANHAARGDVVDVPFSLKSSAIIARQQTT